MIEWLTSHWQDYGVEYFCLATGLAAAWSTSILFDMFQPASWSDAFTRKVCYLACVVSSVAVSAMLWYWLDPEDKAAVRITLSAIAAVGSARLAPYMNPVAIAALHHWAPWAVSAFKKPPRPLISRLEGMDDG